MATLAFLVMIHHDFPMFRRLFRAIYRPDHVYAIHVDLKSPPEYHRRVLQLVEPYENVLLLPRRRCVWGGSSQVYVKLDGIAALLARHPGWSHFIDLSGQCYPLRPCEEIAESLRDKDFSILNACDPFAIWGSLASTRIRHVFLEVSLGRFSRVVPVPIFLRSFPNSFVYSGGSSWSVLHRDFCRYALESEPAKRLLRFLRFAKSPDEIYFQSLIRSSPFRERLVSDNMHYIKWVPGRRSPEVLTLAHWQEIAESDRWFARKFASGISDDLLDRIDREKLGLAEP